MRAKQEVKGIYALMEAFWDITKVIKCSIRGAILVAFCFLFGGILVIASMFVIGHNHDKKLAAEIRAQNEALAKMASQGSAHMIPIAGHHQASYAGVLPHASHAQSAYQTHPAMHDPYSASHPSLTSTYTTHGAYQTPAPFQANSAYPAQTAYPTHGGYSHQAVAYPAQPAPANQPPQPPMYASGSYPNTYPAQAAHPGYTTYPAHSTSAYHGYQQPVNLIAVDPIYDSAVTRSQYNQMMQNTPMVASPYGNSINNNPAPIDQPPAQFGLPQTHNNTAVADANEFAGTDAGRAEAEETSSVSNTY